MTADFRLPPWVKVMTCPEWYLNNGPPCSTSIVTHVVYIWIKACGGRAGDIFLNGVARGGGG